MGPGEANDFLYDNGLGVMAKLATSYNIPPLLAHVNFHRPF